MTHYRPWEPLLAPDHLVRGTALVIAPHPDDEVIGCGGAILAHNDAGAPVHVAIMTDGGLGNPGGEGGSDYTAMRKQETRLALDRLGGGQLHFLDHPDGRLKASYGAVTDLTRLIERVRPASLFLPSPYELHPDHRAASLFAFRAIRGVNDPPRLLCYEVGAMMPGNLLVNVTDLMPRKVAAIEAFPSQLLHQDLVEKVRAVNRARTSNVPDQSVRYAEAYLEVRAEKADAFVEAVDRLLELSDGMGPLAG